MRKSSALASCAPLPSASGFKVDVATCGFTGGSNGEVLLTRRTADLRKKDVIEAHLKTPANTRCHSVVDLVFADSQEVDEGGRAAAGAGQLVVLAADEDIWVDSAVCKKWRGGSETRKALNEDPEIQKWFVIKLEPAKSRRGGRCGMCF